MATQLSNFSDTFVDETLCVSVSIGASVIYACVGNYSAVDIVSTCKYCSVNSYKVIQSASHVAATHNQVLTNPKWVISTASEQVIKAPEIAPEWVIMAAPEWLNRVNPCRMSG